MLFIAQYVNIMPDTYCSYEITDIFFLYTTLKWNPAKYHFKKDKWRRNLFIEIQLNHSSEINAKDAPLVWRHFIMAFV